MNADIRDALARVQDARLLLLHSHLLTQRFLSRHASDVLRLVDHFGEPMTADLLGMQEQTLARWLESRGHPRNRRPRPAIRDMVGIAWRAQKQE